MSLLTAGMVPQSTKGLDEVKNSNPPAPDVNKPNDGSLNTFSDSKSVDNSLNKPFDATLDKPFDKPLDSALNKPFDTSVDRSLDSSYGKTSSNDNSLNKPFDKPLDNALNKPFDTSLDKSLDSSYGKTPSNDNSLNKPFDPSFDKLFNKPLDSSHDKTPLNDITKPTQFASDVPTEKLPGTMGTSFSEQQSPVSITAVSGHTPGISAPPSSAAINSSIPSRNTSLPFGRSVGGSTDSETGYKSIGDQYQSTTSGSGPNLGAVNAALPALGTGTGGGLSASDASYKPFADKEHNAPSSTISMKSGHIGSGPTHGALSTSLPPSRDASLPTDTGYKSGSTGDSVTGNLPPIASPVDNGRTPRASELEKEDLQYLAPAIASREKIVPTTAAASKPLVDTDAASKPLGDTKFAEGSSAHPTPASPHSARSSDASGHSRNASGASAVSVGGTKRKVTLAKRIKGEAKILSGKLTKNTDKVQQGRDILSGEQ